MTRLMTMTLWALAALASLVLAAPAAGQIYVRGSYSGTESGTAEQPFNTLSEAQSAAVSGSVIYLFPEVYRDVLGSGRSWSSTGKSNLTFAAWPGVTGSTTRPVITGAVGVVSAALSNEGPDIWEFDVADAAQVVGVTFNYHATTKPSGPCAGSYGGWLTEIRTANPANDLATVDATPNSWALSATIGAATLRVNIAGTGLIPPADNAIEWIRGVANGNAISITSGDGNVVEDIDFDRINARFGNVGGNAVRMLDSTGSAVRNCTFSDCDFSAVIFLGATNINNTVSACTFRGVASREASNQLAWNLSSGTGTITGARATNCKFFYHGLYTRSFGVLPPRPTAVSGWESGYSMATRTIACSVATVATQLVGDVEIRDCDIEYDPDFFLLAASAGYTTAPDIIFAQGSAPPIGDETVVANYPVRLVRVTVRNGMAHYAGTSESVAFDRCRINLDAGKSNAIYQVGASNRGAFGFNVNGLNSRILLSGSVIYNTNRANGTNTYATLTYGPLTSATANCRLIGIKSTIIDAAIPSTNLVFTQLINGFNGSANQNNKFRFVKCAFIGATNESGTLSGVLSGAVASYPRRILYDSTFNPNRAQVLSQAEFSECFYYGFPTDASGRFTTDSAINAGSEWCSNLASVAIDRAGVFNQAPLLQSVTTGEPSAASPLRTPRSRAFEAVLGINGRPGTNIGAYQYGAVGSTPY